MLIDRCKLVAEAYANLDAELLIDALDEDCVYESQKVLIPLKGKNDIADYIRDKFKTIKANKASITCSVRRRHGQPCVVLMQGDTKGVVLLELSKDEKISRIDLCVVPSPAETSPL
jgi:hypothetical protein